MDAVDVWIVVVPLALLEMNVMQILENVYVLLMSSDKNATNVLQDTGTIHV